MAATQTPPPPSSTTPPTVNVATEVDSPAADDKADPSTALPAEGSGLGAEASAAGSDLWAAAAAEGSRTRT